MESLIVIVPTSHKYHSCWGVTIDREGLLIWTRNFSLISPSHTWAGKKRFTKIISKVRAGYLLVAAVHLHWGVIKWLVKWTCVWGRLAPRGVLAGQGMWQLLVSHKQATADFTPQHRAVSVCSEPQWDPCTWSWCKNSGLSASPKARAKASTQLKPGCGTGMVSLQQLPSFLWCLFIIIFNFQHVLQKLNMLHICVQCIRRKVVEGQGGLNSWRQLEDW